jgi:predicted nucleotidyltransferase
MEPNPPLPGAAALAAAERAVAVLRRDSRVRLVYLYGSAADPARPTARDVDLAVLTEPAWSLEELMRVRADLVAAAGADIDLVLLNDASVVLAHEVVEGGRCLHADPPEAETAFVTRTRARYWDFKPFLDEQWRLAGERLEERRRGP